MSTRAASRSSRPTQKQHVPRSKRRNPAASSKSEPVSKRRKVPATKKGGSAAKSKPLKVCDVLRSKKVGIQASSLKDLRSKIKKKRSHFPDVGDDFELVLEEDCTAVEEEDYFQTLPDNTVVMAIQQGKEWMKAPTLASELESGFVEVDGQASSDDRLVFLAEKINKNPAFMPLFPKADLEVLVDADTSTLQVLLRQSVDDTKFIQDICERRLNDLIKTERAQSLIDLYHRAKSHKEESTHKHQMEKMSPKSTLRDEIEQEVARRMSLQAELEKLLPLPPTKMEESPKSTLRDEIEQEVARKMRRRLQAQIESLSLTKMEVPVMVPLRKGIHLGGMKQELGGKIEVRQAIKTPLSMFESSGPSEVKSPQGQLAVDATVSPVVAAGPSIPATVSGVRGKIGKSGTK